MKRLSIAAILLVLVVTLGCLPVSAEAAPLSVTVALDRATVAVGETLTGHWTASGGTALYSNLITTSWIVRSAGSNLTYTAVVASDGAGGFESSFTPATGESLYLRVTVRDAAGISVSAETPVIPVTGAAPVEPLAITVSLDKASVAIGEAVTAQWSVTGGESPYQPLITTMWYAGGATTTARVETLGGGAFSSSFTPASGTSVQLRVSMRDAAGRTESVYSAAIPVYFQYAQGLSLQPASLEVHAQESAALQAVLAPANASDKRVAWSSSDAAVASVDGDGLVRGVSEGEAVITATAMDGSGVSAQAAVRILPPIPVDSVTLSGGVRVNVGGAARLTAAVLPGNAADKTLVWTTGDARIATVADGVVTGMGYGETTVTATAASGAHATETVTVDPAVRQLRALAYDVGFSIVSGSRCISFTAGAEYGTPPYRLRLKLYFDGTLKTASEYIVSAAEDFLVPVGSAAINARVAVTADVTDAAGHESSASASALILADGLNIGITQLDEVPPMTLASGVALDRSEATLEMGGQVTLAAAVSPSGATVRRVAWASANPAVAAVDAGGRVTALKPGTAEVTAVTMDGSN
ncbi:MAG TPA: Ig-like domain-containing protein, partial [Candidatus Limnocylindria bacterium]|nr:Ig-like domain-containing protein [Candidatus Limnocylindria bacterium]